MRYFRLAVEIVCGKADEPNDQFRNFHLPLLGDKDQVVLEVVAKVEKNHHRKSVRQNSRPGIRAMAAPYMGVRCFYCNQTGHIQTLQFRDPASFSAREVHSYYHKWQDIYIYIYIYFQPFSGSFKGKQYCSDYSASELFRNNMLYKPFADFVRSTLLDRLT